MWSLKLFSIKMSTNSAVIETAKTSLRKNVAEKISKLTKQEKQRQSGTVFDQLINLSAFKSSTRISVFLSTANEIDTEPIVRRIFHDNKKCYVPRYNKAGMQMVKLNSMEDWNSLPLTKWNIKQPLLKEQREDALETGGLDLIICPGVAFTKNGDRLGHGGGYYDTFLLKVKEIQNIPPITVGVAFKEQIFDHIPLTSTDYAMEMVLFASD